MSFVKLESIGREGPVGELENTAFSASFFKGERAFREYLFCMSQLPPERLLTIFSSSASKRSMSGRYTWMVRGFFFKKSNQHLGNRRSPKPRPCAACTRGSPNPSPTTPTPPPRSTSCPAPRSWPSGRNQGRRRWSRNPVVWNANYYPSYDIRIPTHVSRNETKSAFPADSTKCFYLPFFPIPPRSTFFILYKKRKKCGNQQRNIRREEVAKFTVNFWRNRPFENSFLTLENPLVIVSPGI